MALKLALVGLAGFEDFYPAEISGGMRKRAGLARAMALDPDILFFDEPSAGLDPLSSRRLDDLILEFGTASGPRSSWSPTSWRVFLPLATAASSSMPRRRPCWRWGIPKTLRDTSPEPKIRAFLRRGEAETTTAA